MQTRNNLNLKNFKCLVKDNFDIIACSCKIMNCAESQECRIKKNWAGFHVLGLSSLERTPLKDVLFIKDQRS